MAKPDPKGGLVIRYDYLWLWEKEEGRQQGAKDRPCAVVVAVPARGDRPLRAVVCGITHRKPRRPDEGIAVPPKVKAYLGLDAEPSWIITSEANMVEWDDPGIVPAKAGDWTYGFLPPALSEKIAAIVLARHDAGALRLTIRATPKT
jgi:hypothetical protein